MHSLQSFSGSNLNDGKNNQSSKAYMPAEAEVYCISVSDLRLHLVFLKTDGVPIIWFVVWVKNRFFSVHVKIDTTFRKDVGRNCFKTESWSRTLDLDLNQFECDAASTEKLSTVEVWYSLILKVVCETNMDLTWEDIIQLMENRRGLNKLETKIMKNDL